MCILTFQMTGSIRQLTWQNVIKQEFTQPGQYILTLEVFNPVSSIFYTQSVDVYGELYVKQMIQGSKPIATILPFNTMEVN